MAGMVNLSIFTIVRLHGYHLTLKSSVSTLCSSQSSSQAKSMNLTYSNLVSIALFREEVSLDRLEFDHYHEPQRRQIEELCWDQGG
jgi:hypothetical protein